MSIERLRRRVALEAARLIYAREETQYARAKRKAVRLFTVAEVDASDLPDNRAIRKHLRTFDRATPDEQDRLLRDWLENVDDRSLSFRERVRVRAIDEQMFDIVPRDQPGPHPLPLSQWERGGIMDRFRTYELLLLPLEHVPQAPEDHPEGDVLYHSLQVFELARQALPYDEEFLLAALLHDVGKAIDWRDHVAAGLEALEGTLTPRTAWLIEHHVDALSMSGGTLGVRHRRRLAADENFDELMLLADCDRQGRAIGVAVPDVQETIDYLRDLSEQCGESSAT
jgi:hypothetical protein